MTAETDIKLKRGHVVVEAWDLELDSSDRRKNDSPFRRALVHDQRDMLTINYAGDYPNGVRILSGKVDAMGRAVIAVGYPRDRDIAITTGQSVGLYAKEYITINAHKSINLNAPVVKIGNLDLIDEIQKLRKELNELKARVES